MQVFQAYKSDEKLHHGFWDIYRQSESILHRRWVRELQHISPIMAFLLPNQERTLWELEMWITVRELKDCRSLLECLSAHRVHIWCSKWLYAWIKCQGWLYACFQIVSRSMCASRSQTFNMDWLWVHIRCQKWVYACIKCQGWLYACFSNCA